MKPLNRWACSRWEAARRTVVVAGLACLAGNGDAAPENSPLVAKPIEIPESEISDPPTPASAVEAVPAGASLGAEEIVDEPTPTQAPPKAPLDYEAKRTLADFCGEGGEITLRRVTDFRQWRVPVPWRARWPEIEVDLHYQNSGALIPGRSRMELWWAGGMVSQRALDGEAADGNLLAEIPNRRLRPGAHRLELRVLHQAGDDEADPLGEELWTRIDAARSSITLKHQLRPLAPVLSDFPRLMDRHGWEPCRLRLVTAEAWALTGIHLEWISRIVERSALWLESVPMEVTHRSSLDASGDHLFVGLRDEIAPLLPEPIAAQMTDSFLGVFPHPHDDRFFIAVIAGGSREGIEKAVRAFAAIDFGLPPDSVLDLSGIALPELPPSPPSPTLVPGEDRSFAELGGRTWDLSGLSTERAEIPVSLPAGLAAAGSANLKLKLRMAWSPVRRDSTIDVFVNGNREATIPVGKAKPSRFDGYELDLPLRSFRSGKNRIAFQPHLLPPNAGKGKPVNWDSLRFVLRDDSRMEMPEVDREIALPDLGLTARMGIPAANLADASNPEGFIVFMADRESPELSAGCTLLGKLVQTAGRRTPLARLSFDPPAAESHFVAVGSEDMIPKNLLPKNARVRLKNGERAWIAQFESPLKENRLGLVVASAPGADLAGRVYDLIQPAAWEKLSGDAMIWGDTPETLTARPAQFSKLTIFHNAAFAGGNGRGFSPGWILYPLAALLLLGGTVTYLLRRERRRDVLPGRVSIDAPMWSIGSEDRI